MATLFVRRGALVGLIAVLLLASVVPASAYDKFYKFRNTFGATDLGLSATLDALEVITGQYTKTPAEGGFNPWGAGVQGHEVLTGVYSTVIDWGPGAVPANQMVKVGWNTNDHACRLRGLVWVKSNGTTPVVSSPDETLSSVPGGGVLTSGDGYYYWTIINDTPYQIKLTNLELGSFSYVLGTDPLRGQSELEQIADQGIAGKLIELLRDDVMAAWADGEIPDPSARSLLGKLDTAAEELDLARRAYEAGDQAGFDYHRQRAVKAMTTFVKEVRTSSKIDPNRGQTWVEEGNEIIRLLNLLPGGDDPTGGTVTLAAAGEEGDSYTIEIPATEVQVGDSLILHGQLLGAGGKVVLDWVDQAEVKADLTPPDVTVETTSAAPPVGGVYLTPPTVKLTLSEAGYILLAQHAPVDGPIFPTQETSPWSKTFDEAGEYVLAFAGVDAAGNIGTLQTVTIKVALDTTPPVITSVHATPDTMWSPNHEMVSITLDVVAGDDVTAPGDIVWRIVQVDDTLGPRWTGADTPDIVVGPDGRELKLNAERPGNLGPDGSREYTIYVVAYDEAGNASAPAQAVVTVEHDQGNG